MSHPRSEEHAEPVLALREASGHLIRRSQQRHTLLWGQEFNGDLTGPQYAVVSAIGAEAAVSYCLRTGTSRGPHPSHRRIDREMDEIDL